MDAAHKDLALKHVRRLTNLLRRCNDLATPRYTSRHDVLESLARCMHSSRPALFLPCRVVPLKKNLGPGEGRGKAVFGVALNEVGEISECMG